MNYSSIIAFVNPKSGSQKGGLVFEKLRNILSEYNVFDLSLTDPKMALDMHIKNPDLRILVCGGDGTVGWILSELDKFDQADRKPIAILPLGIGNDLARTLGWGSGWSSDEPIESILSKVESSVTVGLDRWSITSKVIRNGENRFIQKDVLPLNVMNNYFSIGVDARILLDFHLDREKNPQSFNNSTRNKLIYVKDFFGDLIEPACKDITRKISVFECDGISYLERLKEKGFHSILILNIPSYSGGSRPWKNKPDFEPQNFLDGKLEIIGLFTKDLPLLQVGGHGKSIAQAENIRIVTEKALEMQIDGEPFLLTESEIIIQPKIDALMLENRNLV